MNMDEKRFLEVCDQLVYGEKQKNGIGTLSEKVLHAVLKHYFEPDESRHEVKVGNYIADIFCGSAIIEIQTANFNKLRSKLDLFLQSYQVTVVYPIAARKWLSWIDPETGEVTKKRKSPKTGTPYEAFFELYKIKSYLTHPNFRLRLLLFDSMEYRFLNGWSEDKKRGSSRSDRIPVGLTEEIFLETAADYGQLIPPDLIDGFTSADYKKSSRLSIKRAQTALNVLHAIGAVERIGKKGNQFVYKRTS